MPTAGIGIPAAGRSPWLGRNAEVGASLLDETNIHAGPDRLFQATAGPTAHRGGLPMFSFDSSPPVEPFGRSVIDLVPRSFLEVLR
jgi:hypothetical protein